MNEHWLYGADADAWGVPDGTSADELPQDYAEWLKEGAVDDKRNHV